MSDLPDPPVPARAPRPSTRGTRARIDVARELARLIDTARPGTVAHHVGSSAVPGLPGKNVVDLAIEADPDEIPLRDRGGAVARLRAPGRHRVRSRRAGRCSSAPSSTTANAVPRPPPRDAAGPRRAAPSSSASGMRCAPIRCCGTPTPPPSAGSSTRRPPARRTGCTRSARATSSRRRCTRSGSGDRRLMRPSRLPLAPRSGSSAAASWGGCWAFSARAMGYRVVALDPDPACPTAAVADEIVVGRYDDVEAARRLAASSRTWSPTSWSTWGSRRPPPRGRARRFGRGSSPCAATQDRLAERRFIRDDRGVDRALARGPRRRRGGGCGRASSACPMRLKSPIGGYDGRNQVRIASVAEIAAAVAALGGGRRPAAARWRRRSTSRRSCPSSARAIATAGRSRTRSRATSTTRGSWSRAWRRRRSTRWWRHDAAGHRGLDRPGPRPGGRDDGRAVPAARRRADGQRARAAGPQQRPLDASRARRRRSSSSTCGRSSGCRSARWSRTATAAMVNLLGTGPDRPARLAGRGCRPRRPRRPRPRLRQATGVRAAQDGPRDGRRATTRTRRSSGRDGRARALRWED